MIETIATNAFAAATFAPALAIAVCAVATLLPAKPGTGRPADGKAARDPESARERIASATAMILASAAAAAAAVAFWNMTNF